MVDSQKKCEKSMLLTNLITLILGIVLAISAGDALKVITAVVGILFIIAGILAIISYVKQPKERKIRNVSLVTGTLMIVGGLYIAVNTTSLVSILTILIGIGLLTKSLFKIQFAINAKSFTSKWKTNLIMGLITMFLGLLLILNPFGSVKIFLQICGVALAIMSVVDMVTTYMNIRSLKDYKELSFVEKNKE